MPQFKLIAWYPKTNMDWWFLGYGMSIIIRAVISKKYISYTNFILQLYSIELFCITKAIHCFYDMIKTSQQACHSLRASLKNKSQSLVTWRTVTHSYWSQLQLVSCSRSATLFLILRPTNLPPFPLRSVTAPTLCTNATKQWRVSANAWPASGFFIYGFINNGNSGTLKWKIYIELKNQSFFSWPFFFLVFWHFYEMLRVNKIILLYIWLQWLLWKRNGLKNGSSIFIPYLQTLFLYSCFPYTGCTFPWPTHCII